MSRKFCPFRYRKHSGHQTDFTKIETLHSILSSKQAQKTERILKAVKQITYKGKLIKITEISQQKP
jgi:hypothetical protein